MNDVYGMSIKQFNDVISEMKTIYPFDDDKTFISNLKDRISNSQRCVEIVTTDKNTGINILMSKSVELYD